ncbi:hypothetical protein M3O57_14815 [Xanthomonas nasturtii]|uniref:hypothetical protein n=1 Tax=Xanthomonas nasturtii TaxID=1843581 RepID=UPI001C6E7C3F|nr:hypothetical protein [Xanthomonas nasturtii]MCL1570300.1 hypothetical protein [Xanthomonas nasturtii]MCL1585731.1 hypothetical protein [Xanthomonas nasturtii]MCL1591667.1 hypothetical protein [Xanthomonas nasturtii]MCL1661561.1 hypothetical protein [Xanthomonas nasturtii]
MMGAVAAASAQSFDVDQGRAIGGQQLQCPQASDIGACLSDTVSAVSDWSHSWF